jgi:hypothetical protein
MRETNSYKTQSQVDSTGFGQDPMAVTQGHGNETLESTKIIVKKSKAVPTTGHEGLWGCEMLKIPHFQDSRLTDGREVVSLMCWPHFTSQKDVLVLISVIG